MSDIPQICSFAHLPAECIFVAIRNILANHPLISVIVPCYNQAQFLPDALQSVLNQSYQNWECIIVNDGSPDNTEEVATQWSEKDKRFQYLQKTNGGLSSARNAGLKVAKGAFIQFLDADDTLKEDKFLLSVSENHTADLIICNFETVTHHADNISVQNYSLPKENFTYEDILMKWDIDFVIPIHCGLFRSTLIKDFVFNEQLKAKEDWLMWIYIFSRTSNVSFVEKPLASYRMHDKSMTKDFHHMLNNSIKVYEHLFKNIDDKGRQILFKKILNLYATAEMQNPYKKEISTIDAVEIINGRRALGFIGDILYRILRKAGYTSLNRKNK